MRLSTKGRYAVTAMLDLAIHNSQGPVTLANISECQNISLSYLEQLFSKLRKSELVKGIRGPGGGYQLNRLAKDISIADIIQAVDEKVDATRCYGQKNCQKGQACLTHELWNELSGQIFHFLQSIFLEDLIKKRSILNISIKQDELSARNRNNKTVVQPFQGGTK